MIHRLRPPDTREIAAAWDAVSAMLEPTPVIPTDLPSPLGLVPGWLKLETMQPTGSFKVRGATAALQTLPPGARAVSASAGNHALGMAWAATHLGVPVTVVTAENASAIKVAAIEAFTHTPRSPVTLLQHGLSYEEAETYARGIVATDPASVYVSSYSDYAVIAGQSTAGRELEATSPPDEPVTLVTPLGGGGLASGLTVWASRRGHTRLVAVEAAQSRAVSSSITAGRAVDVAIGATIADGLAGNLEVGSPTPAIIGDAVAAGWADLVAVSEEELAGAIRWLYANHGLVTEGAGAAGVAAVLAGRVHVTGRLVILVSGRNITPDLYARLLAGLAAKP
jgi:threonine dehydratase